MLNDELIIDHTEPVDWLGYFETHGVPEQKARIVNLEIWGWVLDIGDPHMILCIEPPSVDEHHCIGINEQGWLYKKNH